VIRHTYDWRLSIAFWTTACVVLHSIDLFLFDSLYYILHGYLRRAAEKLLSGVEIERGSDAAMAIGPKGHNSGMYEYMGVS